MPYSVFASPRGRLLTGVIDELQAANNGSIDNVKAVVARSIEKLIEMENSSWWTCEDCTAFSIDHGDGHPDIHA